MKHLLRFLLCLTLACTVPAAQAAYLNGQISSNPAGTSPGLPVRGVPQDAWRVSFASTVAANGVDTNYFTIIASGTGQAVSQSNSNLVMTSGTTANAETIIRSVQSWNSSFNLRWQAILSQRIAQNNFYVEMVDVIGDGLALTVNSATSITVTIPGTTWTTASNAGQTAYIGAISGVAGIPMKGTIASVSGTAVTFTVAGWPASGSGTCSVYGWNYHHVIYTSTTATNASFDCQRKGWPTGETVATINTTAGVGHMGQIFNEDAISSFNDSLVASTLTPAFVTRATRYTNFPSQDTNLYLQIRMTNGTTNPASTTTLTVGFISVEDFAPMPVAVKVGSFNGAASLPVVIQGTPAVTVSSGTVTTVSTVTTLANGQTAHSAASTGSPVRVGGRVISTLDTALVQGDASDVAMTTGQQLVIKPHASSENDWFYAAAASGIVNTTTAVTTKTAGAASVRNFITDIQVYSEALTNATELAVRDGAAGTVIWRIKIPTTGMAATNFHFTQPLRGTAATLVEVVTLTASGAGAVYVNMQGYQSF